MVQTIAREMGEIDPENKEQYDENAQEYIMQLEDLDKEIQNALEGVQNRKLIVFHPAFGYLADDYGLEMYALEEEGKEATPQKLQEMIDLAKEENIKAIFYQAEISSAQAESFAEEIGGKTVQLEPLASNYIENLKNMAELISEVMQ
jgi:zinc transport system substrate-binding protein